MSTNEVNDTRIPSTNKLTSIIREIIPGFILVLLSFIVVYTSKIRISLLPFTAIFALFFTGALVSRSIMRKHLSKLYSWRFFNMVSPLFFTLPLILMMHTGYEYAYAYIPQVLELASSMLMGLGVFLVIYPILRVM